MWGPVSGKGCCLFERAADDVVFAESANRRRDLNYVVHNRSLVPINLNSSRKITGLTTTHIQKTVAPSLQKLAALNPAGDKRKWSHIPMGHKKLNLMK